MINENTELAVKEPSILSMLQGVIEGGISGENVAALEKLCDLKLKVDAINAEKAFAVDFIALQRDMPKISATQPVPNNDGTVRYKFAPLDEIDAQLRPVALRHGFTYSFSEGVSDQPGRVTKICIVQHRDGHSRSHPFTVRIGSGPPRATESQADGAAHSYAKRGALCDAFGIIVDHDDDAASEGGPVTLEQAGELERRVWETGADEARFLKFAGATRYSEIPATKYAACVAMLDAKERTKSKHHAS